MIERRDTTQMRKRRKYTGISALNITLPSFMSLRMNAIRYSIADIIKIGV